MEETRTEKNLELQEELDKDERREKSKKVFKILFWIFLPLFVFFSLSYLLLRFVGNMGITVREYAIYNSTLPEDFNGIKVIQFSDIHYNEYSSFDKIKSLVELINKTNPDIVIFTGDLIDSNYSLSNDVKESFMEEFKNINATINKYAIKGEDDSTDFKDIFDNSGFEILENKKEIIYIGKSQISLLALDENYSKSDIESDNNFKVVITHKPDNATSIINDYNPELILAGHSHNGQIVLPFIGGIMKKEGAKKYYSPYYKINDTELYISGGLGNSDYEFRLFNHPSINFYRLRINK